MAGLKFNVAMTDSQIFPVTVEREILAKAGADVSEAACRSEGEVLRLAQDADGILNVQAKIPRGVIEKLTKCKVIARYGIGYDTVDLAAATERGICVCNVPAFCVDEVADTTLSLILATTRKLIFAVDMVRGQNWARQPLRPIHRLRGQT
ncbi:MAG: C-terminal binding protein, partial [Planctomycetes bacterium]|nr:C-terminal binding protein [Planctomycetota bacterium]